MLDNIDARTIEDDHIDLGATVMNTWRLDVGLGLINPVVTTHLTSSHLHS